MSILARHFLKALMWLFIVLHPFYIGLKATTDVPGLDKRYLLDAPASWLLEGAVERQLDIVNADGGEGEQGIGIGVNFASKIIIVSMDVPKHAYY